MKNLFSKRASEYERYRPKYPQTLFAYLSQICTDHKLVWDSATGNGQAACGLAAFFQRVVACDMSSRQLQFAHPHPRVEYRQESAEQSSLENKSVSLVVVAAALHWFDLERFYSEVRRVAMPSAPIATWTYDLPRISEEIDAVIQQFFYHDLADMWPPGKEKATTPYEDIDFPFLEIETPTFKMVEMWNLHELIGYARTWSALQTCSDSDYEGLIESFRSNLEKVWGAPETKRKSVFPITLRVGII